MNPNQIRFTKAQREEKKRSLVVEIENAARRGDLCPASCTLGKLIGASKNVIAEFLRELKAEGIITVSTIYCGMRGNLRHVRFANGLETAKPKHITPIRPITVKPPAFDTTILEQAKTKLRRRGFVVHEPAKYDRQAPPGIIHVDHMRLTAEQVIAQARSV